MTEAFEKVVLNESSKDSLYSSNEALSRHRHPELRSAVLHSLVLGFQLRL
jgi:type II secretory pathway component PulC